METLEYITKRFKLDVTKKSPIEIPDFGREGLAAMLRDLEFVVGVEVGVERGEYSEVLCRANPQMMVYGVDPWKIYRDYREHVSQRVMDEMYKEARQRLRGYTYKIIKTTSLEAADLFEDDSLDFVYLDANHRLEYMLDDLETWVPKIHSGGIIAGHDYIRLKNGENFSEVPDALELFTTQNKISPWFILGIRACNEGEVRDKPRSWMWVIR